MSRLQQELHRLYPDAVDESTPRSKSGTLVLELARPADWTSLSALWIGVQADLGLPPPAIVVNGSDGLQLWFSLAQPVSPPIGRAFLEALRRRHLESVPPSRISMWPAAGSGAMLPPPAPRRIGTAERWSAFVAPDLAPLFSDTPWLDIEPGEEAQAGLLTRLQPASAAQFASALAALHAARRASGQGADGQVAAPGTKSASEAPVTADDADRAAAAQRARHFLLSVMDDPAQPLPQRIDAARALLAGTTRA